MNTIIQFLVAFIILFVQESGATLFSHPLTVTGNCNANELAQELVGPNVVILNSSITGGYCDGLPENCNTCKQFGVFVNGTGVTYYTLEDDFNDVVFMRRGITLSTGDVHYANLVVNNDTKDETAFIRSTTETDVVPELKNIRHDENDALYVIHLKSMIFNHKHTSHSKKKTGTT